jgi:hypothetical protein
MMAHCLRLAKRKQSENNKQSRMSTEIYVQYLNNNAVPIETSYGRGPQHTLPLITVGHVIQGIQHSLLYQSILLLY